jgi:hypothetical protein
MPSKKILTLLGVCLFLSFDVLIAAHSNAADCEEEVKSKRTLVPVKADIETEGMPYFPEIDSLKKVRLSREDLLRQAFERMKGNISSKPVRFFVDEDEQPLASDLKSFFAQYNRGDA